MDDTIRTALQHFEGDYDLLNALLDCYEPWGGRAAGCAPCDEVYQLPARPRS